MEAYAATFKRVEKKYCLSAEQYRTMLMIVQQFLKPDDYPKTVVSSLYFDTPENQLISRSLEKPLYKEKLRVRSYGIAQPDGSITPVSDQVFVELKKKYRGVVYKRRLALSTDAARAFLSGMDIDEACALFPLAGMGKGCTAAAVAVMCGAHAIVSADDAGDAAAAAFASAVAAVAPAAAAEPAPLLPHERQVAREITAFLQRYPGIRPAMVTQCARTAWSEPGNPGCSLRITFDFQLRAGHPAGDPFAFRLDNRAMDLLRPGQVLMEIKQGGGMPFWLVNALSQNQIYPRSFSKYGTAYEKEQKELKHA